jgi:hypothetical protein
MNQMRTSNISRAFSIAAVIALSVCLATSAKATITVTNLSQNTATGVFTYTVQLDAAADVQTNDGFVIYDFPGLESWSISGGVGSPQFTLAQTLTSNVLTDAASVDANGDTAALANDLPFDNATVPNLSFSYMGPPVPFDGAATATLTLTSSVLGGDDSSVYASVDHSGPNANIPYSFSSNPVSVPISVPEPSSSVLFGVVALAGLCVGRRNHAVRC